MTRAYHAATFIVADVRALAAQGLNRTEIAARLRITWNNVTAICNEHEITTVNGNTSRFTDEQLAELLRRGNSQAECARRLGVGPTAINQRVNLLHQKGVNISPKPAVVRLGGASPAPVAPASPFLARLSSKARSDLYDTGRRWADLRDWCATYGFTATQAQQFCHQLEVPVSKGGKG